MKTQHLAALAVAAALAAYALMLLSATTASGQCPGGRCPGAIMPGPIVQNRQAPAPAPQAAKAPGPAPAWRFVEPRAHYAAVVRIRGELGLGRHALGSGAAIRWVEQPVVLTARHVVKDCKKVWVHLARPKRWAAAATVKVDSAWDVAILTLAQADAAELEPAEIAWGEDATPPKGARLESCGFGPDGRLAVNSGTVLRYCGNGSGRWTDWIELSGRARQGDSGGPVFDAKGRVVGVLWGTDNRTVTATQAGYLHLLLAESLGPWREAAPTVAGISRETAGTPGCSCAAGEACRPGGLLSRFGKGKPEAPAPAPPQVIVNTDPEVRSGLKQIEGTLGQVERNTAPKPEPPAPEGVPLWAKVLLIVGAVAVGALVFYVVQQN